MSQAMLHEDLLKMEEFYWKDKLPDPPWEILAEEYRRDREQKRFLESHAEHFQLQYQSGFLAGQTQLKLELARLLFCQQPDRLRENIINLIGASNE